jgi:outer membrane protein OmpA-like peptidoglycan-associated protein
VYLLKSTYWFGTWLLALILLLLSPLAIGQRNMLISPEKQWLAKGKEQYEKGNYTEAIALLTQALAKDSTQLEVNYYLGLAYVQTGDDDAAIPLLTYYTTHAKSNAGSTLEKHKAMYRLHYAREQRKLKDMPLVMNVPVKLPDHVNTTYPDYSPVMDATGTRLFFTSRRLGGISSETMGTKEGDEDGYFIEKSGTGWSSAQLLPEPLNSSLNEGVDSFSADGQFMVMTGCNREQGIGSCDLYYSVLQGDQWSVPESFGDVVNSVAWDSQATLSFDGMRMIFVSGRDHGYGETDFYLVERNHFGEWGPAMNLGPMINTPFTEDSPFLSQDGKTLYFSSNGHPGFGGMDIFKTVLEEGKWLPPVNLGRPLNTPNDDRFFTIGGSGEKGYFSSNRDGGTDDLYEIEIPESMRPEPTIVVSGIVTNLKDGRNVGAYILVEDLNTGELIAANKSNAATGQYLVVLPAGRTYSVSANKEGYFFYSQRFEVPKATRFQEITKDIQLKPIEKGAKVVLNNIFFETGKATLTPQSRLELEKAMELLRVNPSMVIEVGGHTDNVGDDNLNMKLSHDRARSVRDYLVNGGVPPERVQAKGYGELNPVATNDTEDGRKANRRTEFVILEF